MRKKESGWVVLTDKHPYTGKKYIAAESFSYTRKGSIKKAVGMLFDTWPALKKEGWRCVKATRLIIAEESEFDDTFRDQMETSHVE